MRAEWGTHFREDRRVEGFFMRKPEGKKPLPRHSHRFHTHVGFKRDNYGEKVCV